MNAPTDEQLLIAHLANKPDAFELLVRRHNQELYRFVLRFTNNSAAAEDVVQEAFLQVYQSAATFDQTRRFKPWLFTIAANKARDWLRVRNRRSELPLDAQVHGDQFDGEKSFRDLLAADQPDHTANMEFDDQRRQVRIIVEKMPDNLREVLVLAYYHKLPYKTIAEVIHIPVGTVKSRLHSAVAHFGRAYREATETEPQKDVEHP